MTTNTLSTASAAGVYSLDDTVTSSLDAEEFTTKKQITVGNWHVRAYRSLYGHFLNAYYNSQSVDLDILGVLYLKYDPNTNRKGKETRKTKFALTSIFPSTASQLIRDKSMEFNSQFAADYEVCTKLIESYTKLNITPNATLHHPFRKQYTLKGDRAYYKIGVNLQTDNSNRGLESNFYGNIYIEDELQSGLTRQSFYDLLKDKTYIARATVEFSAFVNNDGLIYPSLKIKTLWAKQITVKTLDTVKEAREYRDEMKELFAKMKL